MLAGSKLAVSAEQAPPIPVILTSFEVAMNDGKKLQVKSRVKLSMKTGRKWY